MSKSKNKSKKDKKEKKKKGKAKLPKSMRLSKVMGTAENPRDRQSKLRG